MQDQQPRRSIPLGVLAGFSALILATGGAVAYWTVKSNSPNPPANTAQQNPPDTKAPVTPVDPSKAQTSQSNTAPVPVEKTLQIYWLKPSDTSIQLAPAPFKGSSDGDSATQLTAAVNQLLAGPQPSDGSTTIPSGTKLRSLTVEKDGIHVDLSKDFTTGGGSASMTGRLAQILYTTTSLEPSTPVWFSVEGKPLETLGGEGLVLEQPLTRQQFEKDFPM